MKENDQQSNKLITTLPTECLSRSLPEVIKTARDIGLPHDKAIGQATRYRIVLIKETPVAKLTPGGTALANYFPGDGKKDALIFINNMIGAVEKFYRGNWTPEQLKETVFTLTDKYKTWSLSDFRIFTEMCKAGNINGNKLEGNFFSPATMMKWADLYEEYLCDLREKKVFHDTSWVSEILPNLSDEIKEKFNPNVTFGPDGRIVNQDLREKLSHGRMPINHDTIKVFEREEARRKREAIYFHEEDIQRRRNGEPSYLSESDLHLCRMDHDREYQLNWYKEQNSK